MLSELRVVREGFSEEVLKNELGRWVPRSERRNVWKPKRMRQYAQWNGGRDHGEPGKRGVGQASTVKKFQKKGLGRILLLRKILDVAKDTYEGMTKAQNGRRTGFGGCQHVWSDMDSRQRWGSLSDVCHRCQEGRRRQLCGKLLKGIISQDEAWKLLDLGTQTVGDLGAEWRTCKWN